MVAKEKETTNNTEEQREQASNAPDPFDPERLRLSQDFTSTLGVKKAILSIPVRKPSKEKWFRVHPSEEYRIQTGIIELKEDREIYLVNPALWSSLSTEATFGARLIYTTISRQGDLSLWPIRLPGSDGRLDSWNLIALEAAELAMKSWIRLTPNMSLPGYDVHEAESNLSEPEWPDLSFHDILRIAFKDRYIEKPDHPVLCRLRGQI